MQSWRSSQRYPSVDKTHKVWYSHPWSCPAKDEWDGDHIVEWTEDGTATECKVSDRDYREVGWNEEEGRPEYIKAKLLLHNELFNVQLNGSK